MRVFSAPIQRGFGDAARITQGAKDIATAAKSDNKFKMDTVKDLKVLMTALKNTTLTPEQNKSVKDSISILDATLQSHKGTSAKNAFATKLASINNFDAAVNKDKAQSGGPTENNLLSAFLTKKYSRNQF
ncbi:hypothetical protein ACNSO8_16565 [Yersinia sp. LJYL362]|uniref:hypothetical protein n=1 Tax=Yersinia sp. LJYL362 TaxID=3402108 RepID=UPI003AB81E8F